LAATEIVGCRSRSPRAYVAHFNARDFDAIRAMIADDVRLDHASYVIDGAEYLI
jgi:ketosteroid isomerase-like protein